MAPAHAALGDRRPRNSACFMGGQDGMEPAAKRPRLDDAGTSSGSRPCTQSDSDQHCNDAHSWFTGQGIHNSGFFGVAGDVNIINNGPDSEEREQKECEREKRKREERERVERERAERELAERRESLLVSLRFNQMYARERSIKQAHPKTCRWFLKDPEYLKWSKNDGTQSQGGFLWIKGKPGVGKSTLVKFLLKRHRERSEGIIISFFFNARGEDMEKTTLGLYQSLLVQLLELRPSLQRVLDQLRNGPPQWSVELLKDLFEEAVKGLDETSLVCFIDALDECPEQEVRDMIRFLSDLSDIRSRFHVCFASRHYPHITIPKGRSIVLEDKDEHREDIANYLDNALKIGGGKLAEQIRSDLQEKASGVFMWVVLVVDILNEKCDAGEKHRLPNLIRQIPSGLNNLFRDILIRDSRNASGVLLCIQWVLFAMRPLSPRELYYAVLAGTEPESLAKCHTEDITDDDISKFILDKSKGLAESTKSDFPTVQFIHESVRDFLLKDKDGLQTFWKGNSANLEGQSHDALKRACFAYLTCQHISHAVEELTLPGKSPKVNYSDLRFESPPCFRPPSPIIIDIRSLDDEDPRFSFSNYEELRRVLADEGLRSSTDGCLPFLEYATRGVLYHADKAESGEQSQADFLVTFPLAEWVARYNVLVGNCAPSLTPDVSFLYVLAHENCAALIRIQQEDRSCFKVEPERYGTPLFAALALGCTSAVQALVECQKRRQSTDYLLQNLDMPNFEKGWFQLFSPAFRFSGKPSVLSCLTGSAGGKLPDLFCATEAINIGSRDGNGRLPLSYVAEGGHVELAKALLERGADINSTDYTGSGRDTGQTPLHTASENGCIEVVRLCIERGADVHAVTQQGDTPIDLALRLGRDKVVNLLVTNGANPDTAHGDGRALLSRASFEGNTEFVKLLLEKGANIEPAAQWGRKPLSHALEMGHTEVAKLLIEKGADVNATDLSGWRPLFWASQRGDIEVVRMLLEKGADPEAPDMCGSKALKLAVANGHREVVKLLEEWEACPVPNRVHRVD